MSFNPMTSSFGPVIADDARGPVTSSPTYRYVYADYVDEPMLRHTGTTTTLPTTGHSALYYHRNQQYSIVGLTNAAGTLVERYYYSAHGTLGIYAANGTVRSSSTYANRYTYTGREWDADLRLYHFRARWYDPATGGFVTRDPLGYVDGMSLYRGYFGVRGMDPSGKTLETKLCYVVAGPKQVIEVNMVKGTPEFGMDVFDDMPKSVGRDLYCRCWVYYTWDIVCSDYFSKRKEWCWRKWGYVTVEWEVKAWIEEVHSPPKFVEIWSEKGAGGEFIAGHGLPIDRNGTVKWVYDFVPGKAVSDMTQRCQGRCSVKVAQNPNEFAVPDDPFPQWPEGTR